MMIVVWLVLGGGLLFFEMHHLAFYALFGAIGAFAAAIAAVAAPDAIVLQVVLAVLVSVLGVVAVRPYVSRAFAHHRGGQVARGVHGGLVGEEAFTLDVVGSTNDIGHVRLAGERWLAVTDGAPIVAGTRVLVTGVRGTTLTVWPVDGPDELGARPELGPSDNNGAAGATDGS